MKLEAYRSLLFSPKNIALLSLVTACIIVSLSPICVRWSEQEISPSATVFFRFFFGSLIFGLENRVNPLKGQDIDKNDESEATDTVFNKLTFLLLCAGICSACHQLLWAFSLSRTSVGNSALLQGLSPLPTALFAWLFFNKKINFQLLLGMTIAIVGSIVIASGDLRISTARLQGDALALLSAIFFAAYLTVVEQLRMHLSASNILLYRCLLGTILVLPFLILSSERIIPVSMSGWLAIMGLTLTFVTGHWLLASSLAFLSSTLVATALLIDPILTSIQAWIFFSEKLYASEWVSFGIVILGVYLAIASNGEDKIIIIEESNVTENRS